MEFVYSDGGRSKYFHARNVGDCATRAIANATGADYKLVYKALSKLAGKSVRNGCPKNADKKLLTMLGWTWTSTMGIGSGCKVHLCEDELPDGDLVVQVSGHLTNVCDGVLYDTYDCSRSENRCVYGYWTGRQRATSLEYERILKEFLKDKPATKPSKPKKASKTRSKKVSDATRIKRLEKKIEALEAIIKKLEERL